MKDLYSENDLQRIRDQLKKRYMILGCILAAFLALFIYSMVIRLQWLTTVSLALLGFAAVFYIDLFCLPLHRYSKLLRSALGWRNHTETLEYAGQESDTSMVDGVPCRGLLFLGDPDKHGEREQRFYWDEQLPLPSFRPGDQVTLKYTGRNIIGLQV